MPSLWMRFMLWAVGSATSRSIKSTPQRKAQPRPYSALTHPSTPPPICFLAADDDVS